MYDKEKAVAKNMDQLFWCCKKVE